MTLDAVLASACPPFLGQAVVIDGEPCWDGGFGANPPLRVLVEESSAADVLLVRLQPTERPDVPAGVQAVARRMQELAFNAPLQREEDEVAALRAACAGRGLFRSARCRRMARLRLHRISAPEVVAGWSGRARSIRGGGCCSG